jgi:serine/threonine protein kinase
MDDNFRKKLKEDTYKGDDEAYEKEGPILTEVIKKIEEKLKGKYTFKEPIKKGGAGVVFRVYDERLSVDRALKTPRPIGKDNIVSAQQEIQYLKEVKHDNIISIYDLENVEIEGYPDYKKYPYYIMDYIKDAKDCREYFQSKLDNEEDRNELTRRIASTFHKIAKAIEYLHSNEIIHFDIKPSTPPYKL